MVLAKDDFTIWPEGEFYVSQYLPVDIASFGETLEEATENLAEAVELYFSNEE
jgi:predicted RNase H-like HicB family nuclease